MRTLRLDEGKTMLLVVDVQERLAPAMLPERYEAMVANLRRLASARAVLDLPVVVTEQYPKGLGPTVDAVQTAFEGVTAHAKAMFSALKDEAIKDAIQSLSRPSVVVAGMETHICVYQTARDLVEAGFNVHVLADAVASRTEQNLRVGLDLITSAGGVLTSTEVVLFDLLGRAGTDAFKTVSNLVR